MNLSIPLAMALTFPAQGSQPAPAPLRLDGKETASWEIRGVQSPHNKQATPAWFSPRKRTETGEKAVCAAKAHDGQSGVTSWRDRNNLRGGSGTCSSRPEWFEANTCHTPLEGVPSRDSSSEGQSTRLRTLASVAKSGKAEPHCPRARTNVHLQANAVTAGNRPAFLCRDRQCDSSEDNPRPMSDGGCDIRSRLQFPSQPAKQGGYRTRDAIRPVSVACGGTNSMNWTAILEALGQIESDNRDDAVGRYGEISRFQIEPPVWRQYAPPGWKANRDKDARVVAKNILADRRVEYMLAQHKEPDLKMLYNLWARPDDAFKGKMSKSVKERAERFANLVRDLSK